MDKKPHRKNYFLTGLVAVLPLALSLYILSFVFNTIGKISSPIFHRLFELMKIEYSVFFVNAVSVLLTVVLIWVIGLLITNIFGRKLFTLLENVLVRVPILKGIYTSIRQLLANFSNEKKAFKQVVMVQYPRLGLYSIGFVTREAKGQIQRETKEQLISIFIPTTPNPTSGMLIMVPKKDLVYLSMSIDEAVKFVISAGLVAPEEINTKHIEEKS